MLLNEKRARVRHSFPNSVTSYQKRSKYLRNKEKPQCLKQIPERILSDLLSFH